MPAEAGRGYASGMVTPLILVPALVAAMSSHAPPARLSAAPSWPGWSETAEARAERYRGIAEAAVEVAYDPRERALFQGPHGRKRTASLLLAIAFFESGYAPDVDRGPCYPARDTKTGLVRCDGGRSACLLQIQVGAGTTAEGWTRDELFADRVKCFRAGLHLARKSFTKCGPKLGAAGALNAYATGACETPSDAGRVRLSFGEKLYKQAFIAGAPPDVELAR